MSDLGMALRLARAGRSLREAARVLGVDVTTYRAWEAGFMKPQRQENFQALGTFLGVSKAEVLGLLGFLDADEVEVLVSAGDAPRNPTPARARRRDLAPATVPEDQGAYLSSAISRPNLALVA